MPASLGASTDIGNRGLSARVAPAAALACAAPWHASRRPAGTRLVSGCTVAETQGHRQFPQGSPERESGSVPSVSRRRGLAPTPALRAEWSEAPVLSANRSTGLGARPDQHAHRGSRLHALAGGSLALRGGSGRASAAQQSTSTPNTWTCWSVGDALALVDEALARLGWAAALR